MQRAKCRALWRRSVWSITLGWVSVLYTSMHGTDSRQLVRMLSVVSKRPRAEHKKFHGLTSVEPTPPLSVKSETGCTLDAHVASALSHHVFAHVAFRHGNPALSQRHVSDPQRLPSSKDSVPCPACHTTLSSLLQGIPHTKRQLRDPTSRLSPSAPSLLRNSVQCWYCPPQAACSSLKVQTEGPMQHCQPP